MPFKFKKESRTKVIRVAFIYPSVLGTELFLIKISFFVEKNLHFYFFMAYYMVFFNERV